MTREEMSEMNRFKNEFIKDYYGGEYEGWGDYLRFCSDQGFSESEMLYDELMFGYGRYKEMCGVIGSGYEMEWYFKKNKNNS